MHNRSVKKTTVCLGLMVLLGAYSSANASLDPNDALDDSIELFEDYRFEDAADKLTELVKSRDYRRLDSSEKVTSLTYLVESNLARGEPRVAKNYVNDLVKTSKNGFGEHSEEHADAYYLLAKLQYRLGNERDSARAVDTMAQIFERMGDDYRKAVRESRSLASRVRAAEWDEDNLSMDMSEFYSACESIGKGEPVRQALAAMSDYVVVGTDYKPTGRTQRFFENTRIKHARESGSDRENRIVIIPKKDYPKHWCAVYPDGKVVKKVVIAPPED